MLLLKTLVFDQVIEGILQIIDTIVLYLNGLVYNFISFLYQVFTAIASARLFTSSDYQTIARNIYVVIGVISLFLIAYALLKAIVDPDSASKGDNSLGKVVPNVLKVIILIAFVPTIFNFAYQAQEVIIATNVIPKIVLGDSAFENDQSEITVSKTNKKFSFKTAGAQMANAAFMAFLSPVGDKTYADIESNYCWFTSCNDYEEGDSYTLEDAHQWVEDGIEDFTVYANFGRNVHSAALELDYNGIFQLVTGILLIYVLINFCIDLGVRAAKLGYYQIISPFPILTIMIPGQDKMFNNWLKATVSTFVDVFIRIFVIFFAILMINMLPDAGDAAWASSIFGTNKVIQGYARVFIIIGILIFVKQVPKLIQDITGMQSYKFGIKDKLGSMFGVGGAVSNVMDKTQGAVTGGLGAGWQSAIRGTGFDTGFKYGASQGWAKGGKQFDKQRRGMYKLTGGKGEPSLFFGKGPNDGRTFIDKFAEDAKNNARQSYKNLNNQQLIDRETKEDFLNVYNDKYNKAMKEHEDKIKENNAIYQEKVKTYNDEEERIKKNKEAAEKEYNDEVAVLRQLRQDYANQAEVFNKNIAEQKSIAEKQYQKAEQTGDNVAKLAAANKLNALNNEKYSNPKLERDIAEATEKVQKAAYNPRIFDDALATNKYRKENDVELDMLIQSNVDEKKAVDKLKLEHDYVTDLSKRSVELDKDFSFSSVMASARGEYAKYHPTYKNIYDKFEDYRKEAIRNAYVNSDEGQRDIAVRTKAMDNVSSQHPDRFRAESAPPPPPPPDKK